MEYSEDPRVLQQWMPLVIRHRDPMQPVAATRVPYGSDVDFGSLTRHLVKHLQTNPNFELRLNHAVKGLEQKEDGRWRVRIKDRQTGEVKKIKANFVFLGAGGGALPLLQKSGIPESRGYGGFPVSGQWLVCEKPEIVNQHYSKVYGKAPIGAPPMSVPHLDTRIINGEPALLFGPYAGFTTKFQKKGSSFDLFASVRSTNFGPIMSAGLDNMDLPRYLISVIFQSHQEQYNSLRHFFTNVREKDRRLAHADQRYHFIKNDIAGRVKLVFGTELVASNDGTLAAQLGASPGAYTSAQALNDA